MMVSSIPLLAGLVFLQFASIAFGQTTPHELLRDGEPGKAKQALEMIKKDPKWIQRRGENQLTLLHVAARHDHVEVAKWLIENGAKINSTAYNKFTPLHVTSNPKIVEMILARKPVISEDSGGDTPLQKATRNYRQYLARTDLDSPEHRAAVREQRKVAELFVAYMKEDIDLKSAIRLGRLDIVKNILEKAPEQADGEDDERIIPLREAAKWGEFEICQYLIENFDVDIDGFKKGFGYPIIKSALGYPKVVKLLIDKGADLETRISWRGGRSGVWIIGDNATALHYAAAHGHPDTIKILIDAGVPFPANTVDSFTDKEKTQTALDLAAAFGNLENVKALLAHPKYLAKAKKTEGMLDHALMSTITYLDWFGFARDSRPLEVVNRLMQHGAKPRLVVDGQNQLDLLADAIDPFEPKDNEDILKIAKIFREAGCKQKLFPAVSFSDFEGVKKILRKNKSAANSRNREKIPALHQAILMDQIEMVKLLLDAGGDINIQNLGEDSGGYKETALSCAICWERDEIAAMLVKRGADINLKDPNGCTSLHFAAMGKNESLVKLMIEKGGKPQRSQRAKRQNKFSLVLRGLCGLNKRSQIKQLTAIHAKSCGASSL